MLKNFLFILGLGLSLNMSIISMNNKDNNEHKKRTFSERNEEDKIETEKNQIHIDKKIKVDESNMQESNINESSMQESNIDFLSRKIPAVLSNLVADYLKQWVEVKTLSTHGKTCDNFIQSLAFSHNNKYLASSYEVGGIRLWDIKNNFNLCQKLNVTDMIKSSKFKLFNPCRDVVVESLAFSNDNKHLAAVVSHYNCIVICDVNNNFNLLHALTVDDYYDDGDSSLWALAYSPDNKYLITSEEHEGDDDKTTCALKIWDVNDNYNLLDTLKGHTEKARSLAFSKNGKYLASAGEDNSIRLWDFDDKSETYKKCIATFDKLNGGHSTTINSIAFSPNDKYLASGDCYGTIKIWDITTKTSIHTLTEFKGRVSSIVYSPDNKYLIAGGGDKIIKIWDATTYQLIDALAGHEEIIALIFSEDKKYLASADWPGALKIWQYKSLELE